MSVSRVSSRFVAASCAACSAACARVFVSFNSFSSAETLLVAASFAFSSEDIFFVAASFAFSRSLQRRSNSTFSLFEFFAAAAFASSS